MCRVLSFLMTSLTSLAETTDCPLMLMMTSFSLSPPLQHKEKTTVMLPFFHGLTAMKGDQLDIG